MDLRRPGPLSRAPTSASEIRRARSHRRIAKSADSGDTCRAFFCIGRRLGWFDPFAAGTGSVRFDPVAGPLTGPAVLITRLTFQVEIIFYFIRRLLLCAWLSPTSKDAAV